MGVPLPTVSAYYATFVELVGGVALILGLALPLVGGLDHYLLRRSKIGEDQSVPA